MRFKKGRKAGIQNLKLPAREGTGIEREGGRAARTEAAYWAGVVIIKGKKLKNMHYGKANK